MPTREDEVESGGNEPAVCSAVMWVDASEGNCEVVSTPPGGTGRSLTIRYGLPRRPYVNRVGWQETDFASSPIAALVLVVDPANGAGNDPP